MPQSEELLSPWVAITQFMIEKIDRELSEAKEDYRIRLLTLRAEHRRLKQLLRDYTEAPHATE